MGSQEILEQALRLRPDERFALIEGLLRSLDKPDKQLDALWADEAEKRLNAYRDGLLEAIPMEEIFKEEP
ncbi:addiction module protein [Methylomonas sp. MgM2]